MGIEKGVMVLGVLCLIIVCSEWVGRRSWLKHAGTALVVIIFTAVVANLGIIPTSSTEETPVPIYNVIFQYVAPLSILWLLLEVNLKDILKAGLPIIIIFVVGSFGTAIGVLSGMWIISGGETIGELHHAIAGMITGTYTGGSINFNAVAIHYDVMNEGILFAGTVVADNIVTTLWMVITIAIPSILAPLWHSKLKQKTHAGSVPDLGIDEDTEALHPADLALILMIGLFSLWISENLAQYISQFNINIPSILILTVIALILAQFKVIGKLSGTRLLGLGAVYLFLAVIGAHCDVGALADIGMLGVYLTVLMTITVLVHGVIIFATAWIFKIDLDMAAVASQANVGGGTTALALARSIGRSDLVLPAVLLGSLGNALGTFLGFWVAGILS
ncbi:MAG: DUF819 family protein [Saprospiraceae bacterium]|nr:DUF819 family protein [Saprospiraceae bacterium]